MEAVFFAFAHMGGFPCPPFIYRGSVFTHVLGLPSRLHIIGLTEPIRWVGTSSLERGSFRKFHSAQSTHRVVPALIGLTAFFISPVSLCRSLFRGAFAPSSSAGFDPVVMARLVGRSIHDGLYSIVRATPVHSFRRCPALTLCDIIVFEID